MNNLLIFISLVTLNYVALNCDSRIISSIDSETECFSLGKVYHAESDKCYKLLTRGPCQPGYWYVLEKPRRPTERGYYPEFKITAICAREKCPEGGLYWESLNSCVTAKDKNRLCGNTSDEELLNNVFGEGECMCARDPVRARLNGDARNKCYQLYTRGPCRAGEVLGYAEDDTEKAVCIEDKCYEETLRRRKQGKLSRDDVLAPWHNGTCYELGTQGPCPETSKFKVLKVKPDCVTLTTAIFDLEKPQKCYQDENGDCQKKINANKSQNAEKYKEELLSSIIAARKRRHIH